MANGKKEIPKWVDSALQGITYWIGHRRCMYRGYPLAEAALVAEICNLIYTHLPSGWVLDCEVQYSGLLAPKDRPEGIPPLARADLVVSEKTGRSKQHRFVIEVKRASAPIAQRKSDLFRLAAVSHSQKSIRAFMFLVAEEKRPKGFVSNSGGSIKVKRSIPNGFYRVLRTWKAAHAFSSKDNAQYACLIEVFGQ